MTRIASPRAATKARIEIIPLIDVIFFLLATFVLFTLALSKVQSIPLTLPEGGTNEIAISPLNLCVSEAGAVFWNDEPITRAELPARLAQHRAEALDPRVLVSGDSRANYGAAVEVLDLVRAAGIEKVSLQTRPTR